MGLNIYQAPPKDSPVQHNGAANGPVRQRNLENEVDPPGGKRRRGSPRTTWRRTFQGDLKRGGVRWEEVEGVAAVNNGDSLLPNVRNGYEELRLSLSK